MRCSFFSVLKKLALEKHTILTCCHKSQNLYIFTIEIDILCNQIIIPLNIACVEIKKKYCIIYIFPLLMFILNFSHIFYKTVSFCIHFPLYLLFNIKSE